MDELDTLIAVPRVVEGIEVKPLVVRQISPFTKALKNLPGDILVGVEAGAVDFTAVAEHCDVFVEAVAIATDTKREQIGDLHPDQLVALVSAVLAVNLDFFVRRLVPQLQALAAVGEQLVQQVGPMSSSASSNTDIAAPTSSSTP